MFAQLRKYETSTGKVGGFLSRQFWLSNAIRFFVG